MARPRLPFKIEGGRIAASELRERLGSSKAAPMRTAGGALQILGVDPGTRSCGWGVVRLERGKLGYVAHGAVRPDPKTSVPERLLAIYDGLRAVIAEHRPQTLALENVFYGVNVRSAQKIGEGRAVVMLAAAQSGMPVHDFLPKEIKKAVSGYGAASKGQVQDLVRLVLGLGFLPEPHDAADALAAAICLGNRVR